MQDPGATYLEGFQKHPEESVTESRSDSPRCRPLAQGSKNRALTTFASGATRYGSFQFPRDAAHLTYPLLDVGEVMPCQLIHVVAGQRGVVGQCQETANLLQAEAECAPAPDLEAVLASQAQWAPNHTAQPDLVLQAIAGVGLNIEQLKMDMGAPEVAERAQHDTSDAITMKVTATPEYFVNGRSLPSFGDQQLLELVREELQKAY